MDKMTYGNVIPFLLFARRITTRVINTDNNIAITTAPQTTPTNIFHETSPANYVSLAQITFSYPERIQQRHTSRHRHILLRKLRPFGHHSWCAVLYNFGYEEQRSRYTSSSLSWQSE